MAVVKIAQDAIQCSECRLVKRRCETSGRKNVCRGCQSLSIELEAPSVRIRVEWPALRRGLRVKRCTGCGNLALAESAFSRESSGKVGALCMMCAVFRPVELAFKRHRRKARGRILAKARSRQSRQAERRRAAERNGRVFVPRGDVAGRAEVRRHAAAMGVTIRTWERWCRAESKPNDAEKYRRRYRNDDVFRAAEIARSLTKKRSWRAELSGSPISETYLAEMRLSAEECAYCGRALERGKAHIDHIHPRSLGGTCELDNLAVVCAECNTSKGARLPHVWARTQPAHVQRRVADVLAVA